MKRILTIILTLFLAVTAFAADETPQTKYIKKYAPLAVEEMYRSGVPASITLAQGLLESNSGMSVLATKGNNHFGIKCHNWTGKKMYHDDDRRGECFRVYKTPDESFRDHSDFLRYRDRYKFLFDLKPTDYKGWAYGLKKAGYATDPAYPKKLIKLIEDYGLDQYDDKSSSWARKAEKAEKSAKKHKTEKVEKTPAPEEPKKVKAEDKRPESPNSIEQAKPLDRKVFDLALSRQMYSQNGVPFVRAMAGESYASIAASNSLFMKEILKYNDLDQEMTLEPGEVVYLQPKKKKAAKGLDKHVIEGSDENLWEIAQRYGVKMKNLCKMNGITPEEKLIDGEVIRLR